MFKFPVISATLTALLVTVGTLDSQQPPPPGSVAAALVLPPPMDLSASTRDPNGIVENPVWSWQISHPDSLPDPAVLCSGFPVRPGGWSAGSPPCTQQPITVDTANGFNAFICGLGGAPGVQGHLNWFPVAYEGTISWKDHSSPPTDDDYNFRLKTAKRAGYVMANGDSGIGLEFDSDETIDHFGSPWWTLFHRAVDADEVEYGQCIASLSPSAPPPHALSCKQTYRRANSMLIPERFAIVIGLLGLDCEHSCKTELHPVWAMAIHVKEDPSDDVWAIFARNWGNEGYCSRNNHQLDLTTITLRLPMPAASSADVLKPATKFTRNNSNAVWGWYFEPKEHAAYVTFKLPRPEERALVDGELHLRWTPASISLNPVRAFPSLVTARSAEESEHEDAEGRAAALIAKLTPNQRRIYRQRSIAKGALVVTRPSEPVEPTLATSADRRTEAPGVRAVQDDYKQEKDRRRIEALREAYGGKLPPQ